MVATARILIAVTIALGSPALAVAQGTAQTLRELRLLVRAGDTVTLTDTSGRDVRGRIETLSPSAIVLRTPSGPQQWAEDEVRAIRQRWSDPLRNGALIGLGVGAGLGLAGGLALADYYDDAGVVIATTLIYGGIGAGIGAGIDALITRQRLVFEPPGHTSGLRLHIAPLLAPQAAGVRIALTF
jgi:hypothetical protein